jgi:hypothetical protein
MSLVAVIATVRVCSPIAGCASFSLWCSRLCCPQAGRLLHNRGAEHIRACSVFLLSDPLGHWVEPKMTDLLFDTPWWLPAVIAAVGVVLFVTGNKRTEAKLRNAGLAVVLLGIALAAVSYFVDTPLERAEKQSRQLVKAFEKTDWATMSSILDRDAIVSLQSLPIYTGRDEIVAAAKKAHERYGFKSATVLSANGERADTLITVNVVLLTEQDALGRTLNSDWQFEWQERADGWSLVEVRALKIGQSKGEEIRGMFPGR